jgi:hypothetical protein
MSSIMVKPGQSNAVARTTLTMILMVDAALGQLKDLGYERDFDKVEIGENDYGLPTVTLDGLKTFEIVLQVDPDKGISFDGLWLSQPPRRRFLWLLRSYRWVVRKLSGSRAPMGSN